jgi:hypothetical protein
VDAAASGALRLRRAGFGLVSERPARQTNGAVAYGKTVWFRHPLLVSSRRRCCEPNRARKTFNPPMTVTRRIRRRGEHGISRKTIAQGRRNAPTVPVCSCACSYAQFARETAGAAAPGVPCALFSLGRNDLQGPGETRRGSAEVWVVQCERNVFSLLCEERSDEAIHSSFVPLDGLLRYARNDGRRRQR